MLQKHIKPDSEEAGDDSHMNQLAYGSRYAIEDIPKFTMPEKSSQPKVAYQLIHDELELDGRPFMNLASFVNTWMEPEADQLVMENIAKNLCDQDEYPATMVIQGRCISILGNLWHAKEAVGTATVGSSEAVMLGGLALKKRWMEKRRAAGKDVSNPNIIMGHNAQVALEKFARYWDVEARLIPVSEESHHVMDLHKAVEACDENTIGVFVILGSTYTGHFEDVKRMSDLLDELESKTGLNIPIHVDGASGGFVAPFAFPDLPWDFALPRVVSINTSGHKFGLSYAGIGWVLWRSAEYLHKDLVFELHYLGGTEYTYSLNFSRPACFMISQYYNFIRLGVEGYTRVIGNSLYNARYLSYALEDTGYFDLVSDLHRPNGVFGWRKKSPRPTDQRNSADFNPALPVVSFKLTDAFKKKNPHVKQVAISTLLRSKGWIVPNYALPPSEDKVEILRVVVRESLTLDMVERLMDDVISCTGQLEETESDINEAMIEVAKNSSRHHRRHKTHVHFTNKAQTYAGTC